MCMYTTHVWLCLTLVFIEISTMERGSRHGAHHGFMSKRVKPQHTTLQMILGWEKGWKKPPTTKTLLIRARKRSHPTGNYSKVSLSTFPISYSTSRIFQMSVQCLMSHSEINNITKLRALAESWHIILRQCLMT